MNRIGRGRASNRAEATPEAPEVLDFAHFANGTGITSEMMLVNVGSHPIRPALYFYDRAGHLIDPESVVEVTGDLEVTEDGGLSVLTEIEPLGELTISTHGQGELVSGSVKVVSDGPIGGLVRYGVPNIGVAGVGASPPVRDALFPARRQAGGIRTAVAIHNLGAEAMGVSCQLMSGGAALEEVEIPLEANGQTAWFIEDVFTATDTSDCLGAVRCTAPGRGRFTAIAVEMDAARHIFTTLPVVEVNRGRAAATTLDFAHFANGTWTTDLVFVNLSTEVSGPALTPFHTAILPSRPAIYFYDTEGTPITIMGVERTWAAEPHTPAFVARSEITAYQALAQQAQETARTAQIAADTLAAEARAEAAAEVEDFRADYPTRLHFVYTLSDRAQEPPFNVEAMWHDGQFTYLRSHAQESPALYEAVDGDPSLVAYDLTEDGLFIVRRRLDSGWLQIGERRATWRYEPER